MIPINSFLAYWVPCHTHTHTLNLVLPSVYPESAFSFPWTQLNIIPPIQEPSTNVRLFFFNLLVFRAALSYIVPRLPNVSEVHHQRLESTPTGISPTCDTSLLPWHDPSPISPTAHSPTFPMLHSQRLPLPATLSTITLSQSHPLCSSSKCVSHKDIPGRSQEHPNCPRTSL